MMKTTETKMEDYSIGTPLEGLIEVDTTPVRRCRYTWNWDGEHRVSILDGVVQIANFPATHQSRDGLAVVDALDSCEGDGRVQVTSHGAGRVSVQVFDGASLVLDLVTRS